MSVPNQDIVILANRQEYDKEHLFHRVHNEADDIAMTTSKGEAYKFWSYLNRFKDGYELELSQKDCQNHGIKKDAYYNAKSKLIELHYLVPKEENSNKYYFYENLREGEEAYKELLEKPKINSEKPKDESKEDSPSQEKPKANSEKPKVIFGNPVSANSVFPERNTIYNTINKNNKNNTSPNLPNPDTLPVVKKEEMNKWLGEWVVKGNIAFNTWTQKAYRIE